MIIALASLGWGAPDPNGVPPECAAALGRVPDAQLICIVQPGDGTAASGPPHVWVGDADGYTGTLTTNRPTVVAGEVYQSDPKVGLTGVTFGYASILPVAAAAVSKKSLIDTLFPPITGTAATVTLSEGATAVASWTILIDPTIVGAFQYGLAFAFPFGPEGYPYSRYGATTSNGSSTLVVTNDGSDPWVATEVAFGVTLFFREIRRSALMKPQAGLYLGTGILKLGDTSAFNALPSLHAGPVLSVAPNLGLALTASIRYDEALATSVVVGGPATSTTLPKRRVIVPAVGLVLVLSSDTLKLFATRPS